MFIENVSLFDVQRAWHYDPGPRGVLISISDYSAKMPAVPLYPFDPARARYFIFDDCNADEEGFIQPWQASNIARALEEALEERRNVIVNCHAGLCRSGAVVQLGVDIGFQDPEKYRCPNIDVLQMLRKNSKVFANLTAKP